MNNNEFVECKICKAKMKSLSIHIKRTHKITKDKYLEMFPDSELNSKLSSERRSNAIRNNWKDSNYRNSHSESSKKIWKNEEFRKKMSSIASDTLSKKWKEDSEFRDNVSNIAKNTLNNRWKDEEFRNKISSKLVEYNKSNKGRQTSSMIITNYNKTTGEEYRRKNIPIEVQEIIYDRDKFKNFLLSIPEDDRTWFYIESKLNYYSSYLNRKFHEYNLEDEVSICSNRWKSHYEDEIKEFISNISSSSIINNCKSQLYPYELDLYVPDKNLGIEFNGDYWHSELYKDASYHQKKSLYAKEKGIFIYHIWEHEWNDPRKRLIIQSQIKNLLNNNNSKIYARKCEIREVFHKESKEFLNVNHLQGNRNSSIRIGLYYNNELVSLMTFGKDKFIDKSDNWQLLRFCNKLNTSVIGGASRLFKYFMNNYSNNKPIISYCDLSKGKGIVYEKLGFSLDKITPPNYKWINLKDGEILSRYQCQMKDEDNIMSSKGFIKIFDCGNYKFIYQVEE